MPGLHAILSASGASRWLTCTPSARFEEQIPEQESDYAEEGTLAHELAAFLLDYRWNKRDNDTEYYDIKNRVLDFYKIVDTDQAADNAFLEMAQHAEDWVKLIQDAGEGELLIEHKCDLSPVVPLSWGTTDAGLITPDVLYIFDLKYGAGVRVGAKNNAQLMLYGLGTYYEAKQRDPSYNPSTIVLTIFQPRAGGVSTWEIALNDLLLWAETVVRSKAMLAIAGQGDFIAGKHCQFCKARNSCKAYFDRFEVLRGLTDKRVMTPKETALVLTDGGLVSSWVKKVVEDATNQLKAGKKIEGFKLVAGKGQRKFISEDDVIDTLLGLDFEEPFNTTLRSLTDIEKILGKKKFLLHFDCLIEKSEGQPQIVPEDDPRPAIGTTAHDDYNDDELI